MSRRRDVLASVLLSSDPVHAMADFGDGKPQNHHSLKDVLSEHEAQTRVQSRRSLLTTTFFSTKDADPCATDGEDVYGIRIERFSRLQQKFLSPAYVFVRKIASSTSPVEDVWKVHRHTLPACIPIRALAAKQLPEPLPEDQRGAKQIHRPQDLKAFVREVTHEVVSLLRRQEAIEAIQAPGIKAVSAVNAEATDIRMSWNNGAVTRMRVSKSGVIENVVAEKNHIRDEELERRILSAKTLDAVTEKL
jgi:central kinetochore subunit Mal2/MCM21